MTYCIHKIKDFCQVGDGAHASIKREDLGIMYLTTKNFKSRGLDLSTLDYISRSSYEKHFKASKSAITTPCANDVLLGIIGSIGVPYLVKEGETFGILSSVAILRPQQGLDAKFLFYFMRSSIFQQSVDAIKSGAAQGFLSLEMIRNLPLIGPEETVQQQIAEILSACDDLIEINNQRIATLEQLAQQIYKEWFVRMRFPGWENTPFLHGIPIEWEVRKLSSVLVRKNFGKTYKPKEVFQEGQVVVIDQTQGEYLGFHNSQPEHKATIDEPIILFGDHTCKIRIMINDFSLAENIIPFTSKEISEFFVFHLIDSLVETTEYKRHWSELTSKSVFRWADNGTIL
ncbi:MAG: restriction endonuclease subunit S [Methylococcaceae bacterium]